MAIRSDVETARQTLTDFIGTFGLKYEKLYWDSPQRKSVDPGTDWAVFTVGDSFMAWETLHCLAPHIGTIRSCVSWDENGDVVIPLSGVEITLTNAAIRRLWEALDEETNRFRSSERQYEHAGRIVRAVYRETFGDFFRHWEESYSDYNESWWPTQWTHEFPLALGELLKTLDVEAAMLATIAGTSRIDSPYSGEFAALSLPEHVARYELGLEYGIDGSPTRAELRPQDIYTAAYLGWAFDRLEARDSPRIGADERLAHIVGASEAVHTTLSAALDTWPLRSRMSVILDAFIQDVVAPTLKVCGASVAVHLVLDAADARSPVGGARPAFISEVVAPTLRYHTGDLPYYERFASRLRGLHGLARELAGNMRLFTGEGVNGTEATGVSDSM